MTFCLVAYGSARAEEELRCQRQEEESGQESRSPVGRGIRRLLTLIGDVPRRPFWFSQRRVAQRAVQCAPAFQVMATRRPRRGGMGVSSRFNSGHAVLC
jgi:hypothetical protein